MEKNEIRAGANDWSGHTDPGQWEENKVCK